MPAWSEDHLRLAVEAARVALWSWQVDDDRFAMDERGFELWGLPWREQVTFEELSANIHPADRDRVRAAFNATRSVAGSYEIDFRILVGEDVRWISARGRGADEGIIDRLMFGILHRRHRPQASRGGERAACRGDEPPGQESPVDSDGSYPANRPVSVVSRRDDW